MDRRIERLCKERGLRMTGQRRLIAQVLSESKDHPGADELHKRALLKNPKVSIATVYRTLRLLEEAGILERHDFGGGRARYEERTDEHHDHLIDVTSGKVIEFESAKIEALQEEIAARYNYRLTGHKLELYAVPITDGDVNNQPEC